MLPLPAFPSSKKLSSTPMSYVVLLGRNKPHSSNTVVGVILYINMSIFNVNIQTHLKRMKRCFPLLLYLTAVEKKRHQIYLFCSSGSFAEVYFPRIFYFYALGRSVSRIQIFICLLFFAHVFSTNINGI